MSWRLSNKIKQNFPVISAGHAGERKQGNKKNRHFSGDGFFSELNEKLFDDDFPGDLLTFVFKGQEVNTRRDVFHVQFYFFL
jgi:hypothetical protein